LLIDLYIPLAMMIELQKLFLNVALPGVVAIILPTALLLRLIFATRDIGNILIALAFSIYFVLPLLYIVSFSATDSVVQQLGGANTQNPFEKFDIAKDGIVGDWLIKIGYVAVMAILLPNIAMIGIVTMTMALSKGLKGFGV
ncbi:MAG: hypothetical protein V1822_03715, partial [Candidatus Micrarchaeota archaeon]